MRVWVGYAGLGRLRGSVPSSSGQATLADAAAS